jgi:hypothetical protein
MDKAAAAVLVTAFLATLVFTACGTAPGPLPTASVPTALPPVAEIGTPGTMAPTAEVTSTLETVEVTPSPSPGPFAFETGTTCAHAGPSVMTDLQDALNLGADSYVPDAVYVEISPINEDHPLRYAVAATVEGGSLTGLTAVFVTTADLPADDPAGTWYSTDTATRDLSDYSMPAYVEQWALAAPEVAQVRNCLLNH